MIQKALEFAIKAHEGQTRKDGVTPYIVHPVGVADRVRQNGGTVEMYVAALLHDVVEDTDVTLDQVRQEFGDVVAQLVFELTDVYTSEAFPSKNRAERKFLENDRLSKISLEAKRIKLADIDYNVHDLQGINPKFRKRLLEEKLDAVEAIRDVENMSMIDQIYTYELRNFISEQLITTMYDKE